MNPAILYRGIEWLLAALISMISATLILEVAFRYLLTRSLLWAEEFSRFLFLWTAFIGAAAAVGKGLHFSLRSLVDALPRPVRRAAGTANLLAVFALALLLIVEGWKLARFAGLGGYDGCIGSGRLQTRFVEYCNDQQTQNDSSVHPPDQIDPHMGC